MTDSNNKPKSQVNSNLEVGDAKVRNNLNSYTNQKAKELKSKIKNKLNSLIRFEYESAFKKLKSKISNEFKKKINALKEDNQNGIVNKTKTQFLRAKDNFKMRLSRAKNQDTFVDKIKKFLFLNSLRGETLGSIEDVNIDSLPESESTSIQPKGIQPWEGSSAYIEQGRHWSSALIWISSSLFGLTLLWGFTARIDQTVTVRGRLEPTGSVEEVESPSNGVVRKVFIKEGQKVTQGTPLFDVEAKGLASRREALNQTISLLNLQSKALKDLLISDGNPSLFKPLPLAPEVNDPELASKLSTARRQVLQFRSQLQQIETRLNSRKATLDLLQSIADDMAPVYQAGGLARNQFLTQLNQIQQQKAEYEILKDERIRVVAQAASQLDQINKQLLSLQAELVDLKEIISYTTVRAPSDGKVFNLKLSPYKVISRDQVVLKLVPDGNLQATVNIDNSDIGFVAKGMSASVSVDSFPSGEFGYIKGTLTKIGSDALPPDNLNPSWRFPATITLKEQDVEFGEKALNLQSGMSVRANIKLRTRPVITVVTDMFTRQFDGVKRFR